MTPIRKREWFIWTWYPLMMAVFGWIFYDNVIHPPRNHFSWPLDIFCLLIQVLGFWRAWVRLERDKKIGREAMAYLQSRYGGKQ